MRKPAVLPAVVASAVFASAVLSAVRLDSLEKARQQYENRLSALAKTHEEGVVAAQNEMVNAYDAAIGEAAKRGNAAGEKSLRAERNDRFPEALAPTVGGGAKGNAKKPLRAKYLLAAADDFVVDVWHNGEKVPDSQRSLQEEIYGATVEKIEVEVHAGDWLVFNVVNNRLRWGGAHYFAVAGMAAEKEVAFATEPASGKCSACDDPALAAKFIASPMFLATSRASSIAARWDRGDELMSNHTGGWKGEAVWGKSRNTWIKLRVE